MHTTKIEGITLSEELPQVSRFPDYLKNIAEVYYAVFRGDEHLGEIYLYSGEWRLFTICVDRADGTIDGCIRELLRQ